MKATQNQLAEGNECCLTRIDWKNSYEMQ